MAEPTQEDLTEQAKYFLARWNFNFDKGREKAIRVSYVAVDPASTPAGWDHPESGHISASFNGKSGFGERRRVHDLLAAEDIGDITWGSVDSEAFHYTPKSGVVTREMVQRFLSVLCNAGVIVRSEYEAAREDLEGVAPHAPYEPPVYL